MEEKRIKLAEGIVESCVCAYYLINYSDMFDDSQESKDILKVVDYALLAVLHEAWWKMKKQYGKRELKKLVYAYLISPHRRDAFYAMEEKLQAYHDERFKK